MGRKQVKTLKSAIAEERRAWAAVADRFPGTEGHDPELWSAWQSAAETVIKGPVTAERPSPAREGGPKADKALHRQRGKGTKPR
jgi:hypothetical protein